MVKEFVAVCLVWLGCLVLGLGVVCFCGCWVVGCWFWVFVFFSGLIGCFA